MKFPSLLFALCAVLTFGSSRAYAKPDDAKVWTDPEVAAREHADFLTQGEYLEAEGAAPGSPFALQVVALGDGGFDGYLLEGGLPGAGWSPGKKRILLQGKRHGDGTVLLQDKDKSFSAAIAHRELVLSEGDGKTRRLMRVERASPTLGAPPPAGAVVLFDGAHTVEWDKAVLEGCHLMANGSTTKKTFAGYTLHLEFRTPYKPSARGQKRGNSGIYHSGRYETQILDSFGLEGKENECGGIYSISPPALNMCLPPLVWQTYDVEFTAAKFDASGHRVAWPRITVRLNGVLVHENLELGKDFTTAAPISKPLAHPMGPIHLQAHGNPVAYRNIWIVPGK